MFGRKTQQHPGSAAPFQEVTAEAELRRLQLRVQHLESSLEQLHKALLGSEERAPESVSAVAASVPQALPDVHQLVWAEDLPRSSFEQAWGRPAAGTGDEAPGLAFFDIDVDQGRARRWFLRDAEALGA